MRMSRHLGLFSIINGFTENDFTYSGSYTWVNEGSGNWSIQFKTSGTLVLLKDIIVDASLIGGGGGGGAGRTTSHVGAGGGGGI